MSMKDLVLRSVVILGVMMSAQGADAADTALARVNGAVLTERHLSAEIDRLLPQASYHGGVSQEKRDALKEKALQNIIDQELQYQDAVARGMKPDRGEVKALLAKVRDRFRSEKEFAAALRESGLTEDGLREEIARSVLIAAVVKRTVSEPSAMSEDELGRYYDQNRSRFVEPEGVKLRLMTTRDPGKAKDMLRRLAEGEDFGAVAATMSEDPYRVKGGAIGYIHRGRVLPEIEKEAFRLSAGETSGLIQTSEGWCVLKVEEKRPERQVPFDEMRAKLKRELEEKRANELRSAWMARLRGNAKIDYGASVQR